MLWKQEQLYLRFPTNSKCQRVFWTRSNYNFLQFWFYLENVKVQRFYPVSKEDVSQSKTYTTLRLFVYILIIKHLKNYSPFIYLHQRYLYKKCFVPDILIWHFAWKLFSFFVFKFAWVLKITAREFLHKI